MIRVLFFARLREQLHTEQLELETDSRLSCVSDVIGLLKRRGDDWAEAFAADRVVMIAVNQEMAGLDTAVNDNDEVAFFPPVTGG